MSVTRFAALLTVVVPCFLALGFACRNSEVIQSFQRREAPIPTLRLSNKVAVGQPLPMKQELMGSEARLHVFVLRSERSPWLYHDPEPGCTNEECGNAFRAVKTLGGALEAFTNYRAVARAWGVPLISDRWGTRPVETVTVVADGGGMVLAIYRHADLDDLEVVLSGPH